MTLVPTHLVEPGVFEALQSRLDDDSKVREQIREIVQTLEKQVKYVLSLLTNLNPTQAGLALQDVHRDAVTSIFDQIRLLSETASKYPYYKFNGLWTRQMQDASKTFAIVLYGWLGGFGDEEGKLLSIDEAGTKMNVPVNLKDRDAFHLTIEDYLHSLITLIDELTRLARNSVIAGNYRRPQMISYFIRDLHAGFQILNLKNDSLRKRSDSIKYKVREVEDIIYDLSLRNLLPAGTNNLA